MPDWFRATPRAAPDAIRLFCFPPAGGAASLFTPWRDRLLPHIDVHTVQLPGREERGAEPPYTEARLLVRELTAQLTACQQGNRPYAFFGHSLGAAIAYDVACAMRSEGVPGPRALIVSGRRSPYAPRRVTRSHMLSDDEFVAWLVRLGGVPRVFLGRTETYKFFLPLLRADFAVDETYAPSTPPPGVRCPVLAVTGTDDPLTAPADLAAWAEVTQGPFDQREFSGGHFYLNGAPEELLEAIRTQLAVPAARSGRE
ncbi:alpha/beta fold hydrolase [Sphaerimonospora mesophila]|uniref:thioesterase II family protein n=1 Tax=Sphaerimonospora mesophila TaxID=37483 RepID=UPI0006E2007D